MWKYFLILINLRSGDADLVLCKQVVKTKSVLKYIFFNRTAPLWNALTRQLRDAESPDSKHELLKPYDNLCNRMTLIEIYVPGQGIWVSVRFV